MQAEQLWEVFKANYFESAEHGFSIDISRINFSSGFWGSKAALFERAFDQMEALESGALANPDEQRMVGHYWLRDSKLAPSTEQRASIEAALAAVKNFAHSVHTGRIAPAGAERFNSILVIGIGGSALGPQFVTQAMGSARDAMRAFFFDNTDPDGMQRVLSTIPSLEQTLCIVISKSGGTKETRNGQFAAKHAWDKMGLNFANHFVAVTCEGSELDKTAIAQKWLARFPMWDWIGGRTSELSVVGLLPAALQGFDIEAMLRGAREMDQLTRVRNVSKNPAMLLAAAWLHSGAGRGAKDMVVLPYKDRLELFSRYLQQLVMESLGKAHDLAGTQVNQGIAVYGNKGSTDQHAYVQQLRDGLNNFFAVFIEVLKDRSNRYAVEQSYDIAALPVEEGVNSGDYLFGFYEGTRRALYEAQRESISLAIDQVNEYAIGQLIALFERAVGFYASLININAYHQPGVEAGKKAAGEVLALQQKLMEALKRDRAWRSAEELAVRCAAAAHTESVFRLLRRWSANGVVEVEGSLPFERKYRLRAK